MININNYRKTPKNQDFIYLAISHADKIIDDLSKFYGKFNRSGLCSYSTFVLGNILKEFNIDSIVNITPIHCWLTVGQLNIDLTAKQFSPILPHILIFLSKNEPEFLALAYGLKINPWTYSHKTAPFENAERLLTENLFVPNPFIKENGFDLDIKNKLNQGISNFKPMET